MKKACEWPSNPHNERFAVLQKSAVLHLIGQWRNIPETPSHTGRHPCLLSTAFQRACACNAYSSERQITMQWLQTHWLEWFSEYPAFVAERFDRFDVLWIRVPNAIIRQQVHLKTEQWLANINATLPQNAQPLAGIRWTV